MSTTYDFRDREESIADWSVHNVLAKIADGDAVWHRVGDVGYFDEQQRFWYCGRKSQRVVTDDGTRYTECVEAVFNRVPMVYRTALVGCSLGGRTVPVLVYETFDPDQMLHREPPPDYEQLLRGLPDELARVAQQHLSTKGIEHFFRYPKLPTDIRHNSKIRREELAVWAQGRLRERL